MEISGYRITTDPADFDLDAIHGFIGRSYWAAGMPKALLAKAIANSLCFGILADSGEQVGFARVITDRATFGYLSDVYVLEQHRGKGLSPARNASWRSSIPRCTDASRVRTVPAAHAPATAAPARQRSLPRRRRA
jgi:hypothetical protein